jgi:uncharacterized protein (TIGR02284 family)
MTNTISATDTLTKEEIIAELNALVETCKDGQEGFKTAAEDVKNPDYKEFFTKNAAQRSKFVLDLQHEIRSLGGDPEKTGSIVGAIHRGWINLKSAVSSGDENAILAECERGEDSAVETYRAVILKPFPPALRGKIESQLHDIKTSHDKMRTFTKMTEKK